jgi:hypothetical protein
MAKEENTSEENDIPQWGYDFHSKKHGDGLFGGLFLIFLGLIFLLTNLGLLPSSVWDEIWKFWPVLIIMLGIRLLTGKNHVSRLITTILTLFVFTGIFTFILYYYGVLRSLGF